MRAGVAVTFVMFITTLLITLAILVVWHRSVFVAAAFFLVFGLIDASFLSATLNKFTHGGWFPIALAGARARPALSTAAKQPSALCALQPGRSSNAGRPSSTCRVQSCLAHLKLRLERFAACWPVLSCWVCM